MSSIITNSGSMVALQTLKSINKDLSATQNEISTGKKISSAKDGAAIWAIARYMETQVSELAQAQDLYSISGATVSVARSGAEQIVSVLEEMKEIAIAGTSETADFAKLESEMTEKQAQVSSIIGASQFSGVNLLASDPDGAGSPGLWLVSVNTVDFEANLDVASRTSITDTASAATALGEVETYLQTAIDGAAYLGASENRLEGYGEFLGKLRDSLKSGVGALVDADMEESSARLQALQTQQQLGIQALSIANQAPQAILSLFR